MNKPATNFAASSTRARFTTAEFLRMMQSGAFDDMWMELIDGELERMPPPGRSHGSHQIKLLMRLGALVPESRLFGDVAIGVGNWTVLGCDAALLKSDSGDGSGEIVGADELSLVVEVAESTLDRDLGIKRRLYAGAGIPVYWVVDGQRGVVHVYDRAEGDDYMGIAIVKFGEPLAVPGTGATIVLD